MRKPLRPCRHPGCSCLTASGYCPAHTPTHPRRTPRKRSAGYHRLYSLPIWTTQLRPNQLLREPYCRECASRGRRTRAEVVDHVVPHGGSWELFADADNLQSLCKRCHDAKTQRERAEDRG